jgi:hypothetical protein
MRRRTRRDNFMISTDMVLLDWPDDVESEIDDKIDDLELRELREMFRRNPIPWYKLEGSWIIGRIADQIVDVCDVECATKPAPRDHVERLAAMFAEEPARLAELLRLVADHIEQRMNGTGSAHAVPQGHRGSVADPDPHYDLRALARYSGRSKRWLEDRLRDSDHPLPYYQERDGGKITVKRSEYDRWLSAYRRIGNADVDKIVADVMSSLRDPD